MSDITDRAAEIHHAALAAFVPDHPFDQPRFAWRVSPDVWDQLIDWAHTQELAMLFPGVQYQWTRRPVPSLSDRLLGWPIVADETLPPNAMVLEPA